MAALDWSQCSAVESVPGRLGGAWVFRGTRMPVSAVFENLAAGASIEEIIEQFDVARTDQCRSGFCRAKSRCRSARPIDSAPQCGDSGPALRFASCGLQASPGSTL